MKAQLVTMRNMVLAAIQAVQPTMIVPSFNAEASHIPLSQVTDPETKAGRCWVIGSVSDEKDRKTRPGCPGGVLVQREFIINVGYQQSDVSPDDIESLDNLVLLMEQLRDAVKNFDYAQFPQFQPLWVRNEALRDENGMPYHYYMLREGNVFESYFNAYFTIPHQ